MLCPKCKAANRENAKFCDQCGSALSEEVEASEASLEAATEDDAFNYDDAEGTATEDEATLDDKEALADKADPNNEASSTADEVDDDSIETDYELYQPVDSENTDSINVSSPIDKLVFAGEETVVMPAPKAHHDLTGFDRHSEEYTERLASIDYELANPAYRDGGTMQMPRVNAEEAPKSKEYLASSAEKRKNLAKPIAFGIVALLAVAAIAAVATYQQGIWGGKIVPDVVGLTETDARDLLIDEGFKVRAEKVKSDDTEGLVLIMDPAANSRVDEGTEVVINVATARTVPDVSGKSQKEAEELLAEAGYTNIKTKKENSSKKEGTVLKVSPKAGEPAASSTEITLTLAQPYTVPDVSGMLFDDAVKALKDNGLGYDVYYISSDDYPEGTIIGTDPAAGTKVDKGTYVVIQITQPRGAQLEELVRGQFTQGTSITRNGRNFIVESLDSVAYQGNDTVAYTLSAREYLYVFGETISAPEAEAISGNVVFNQNGEIVEIS